MNGGTDFLKNLLNALLPNRAAPVLARVMKAYEGPGKNKYSCDVKVLTAGTLEETDREIAEVPISPVWVGQKGKGLYAIPPENAVVIIEFIGWNIAYPFISGIYSDEYDAGEFKKDQFVVTDGNGMNFIIDPAERSITFDNGEKCAVKLEKGNKISVDNGKLQVILNGNKCAIKNGSKSLFTILDTHLQNLISMKTVGSPAQHVVSPDAITKFTQDKTDIGLLLEA